MEEINPEDAFIVRQRQTTVTICKVCGGSAQYSYYGSIVCQSCKVFFRRNSQNRLNPLICKSSNNCQIDINNRRNCSSCRLNKCFSVGMNVQMIRSAWTKQNTIKQKDLTLIRHTYQHQQIRRLNLLERDKSKLTIDQWNHLTNLINCFDQYIRFDLVNDYLYEENKLPAKSRYKPLSINEFLNSIMLNIQIIFEKNRDLISLSFEDRQILLRTTVEHTTSIGVAILLRQSNLLDNQSFLQSCQTLFGSNSIELIKRLIDQLDPDLTIVKIICSVVAFVLSDCTIYGSTPTQNLHDLKSILTIQDKYVELLFKYLIYKLNFKDAIKIFLNFIRCFLLLTDSVAQIHESKSFHQIIDNVIKSTEEKLHLNQ